MNFGGTQFNPYHLRRGLRLLRGQPSEPHTDRPTNHTCLVKGSLGLTRPQLASPWPLGALSIVWNPFSTPRMSRTFPELSLNFRVGERGGSWSCFRHMYYFCPSSPEACPPCHTWHSAPPWLSHNGHHLKTFRVSLWTVPFLYSFSEI